MKKYEIYLGISSSIADFFVYLQRKTYFFIK